MADTAIQLRDLHPKLGSSQLAPAADFCSQISSPVIRAVSPLRGPAPSESCFRKACSQGSGACWSLLRTSVPGAVVDVLSFGFPKNPVKLLFLSYSCGSVLRGGTEGHTARMQRKGDLSLVLSNSKPSALQTN